MESVFRSFCSFGADKGATPQMDGSKLVKLCRDQQLFDKNLTQTDVDIIFSKVKSKNERKIGFKQFEEALKMIAEKKFPGSEDSLEKLKAKVLEGGGPVAHGVTKTLKTGAVERLSEASKAAATASGTAAAAKDTGKRKGSGGKRSHSTPTQAQNESSMRGKPVGGLKTETGNAKAAGRQSQTPEPERPENGADDASTSIPLEAQGHRPPAEGDETKTVAEGEATGGGDISEDLLKFTEEPVNAP